MKKVLSIVIAVIILCISMALPTMASTKSVQPRYNNTSNTTTSFNIDDDGKATATIGYTGYNGVTTGATITTKIQMKVITIWVDLDGASWVDEVEGHSFITEHEYQVKMKLTKYRLVYEYEIRGTGGTSDVISGTLEERH